MIMHKVMFLALLGLVVGGPLVAQEMHHHVPEKIQRSFHRDYPEARDPQWSSSNGQWHAYFDDHSRYDRGEMVAYYDQYGHHIDSHIPYDRDDVPSAVVERTHRNYPDGKNYTYTRIERSGGQPLFRVELNLENKNRTLYVDESGHEQKYHDHH
jgi:hypothetical protein